MCCVHVGASGGTGGPRPAPAPPQSGKPGPTNTQGRALRGRLAAQRRAEGGVGSCAGSGGNGGEAKQGDKRRGGSREGRPPRELGDLPDVAEGRGHHNGGVGVGLWRGGGERRGFGRVRTGQTRAPRARDEC